MKKTKAKYGKAAREALFRGVEQVRNAVAPTLGAKGKNAIYKRYGAAFITNDGVSIAREIVPEDAFEYLGAEAIKQSSEQTNFEAGDGTTSTVVVTHALMREGIKLVDGGYDPMKLRRELEDAETFALQELGDRSRECESLLEVARISVEDEKIAKLVSEIVEDTGVRGSVIVEESPGTEVEIERVKGYWYDQGYLSPYMITNEKSEAVLHDCAVVVTDKYMNLNKDLFGLLTQLHNMKVKSLLVIADNVEGELLQTMIANKMNGALVTVAVRRPQTIEGLEDIATITGATAVTKDKGIMEIGLEHIGKAEKVIVTNKKTIIVGNSETKGAVESRIKELEDKIEQMSKSEKYGAIEDMKERLARLSSGLAVIKVGSRTDADRGYLKLKVDDAVGACRSALEEGVVAGGGTTLRDISFSLNHDYPTSAGMRLLASALIEPYLQILRNAGMYQDRKWYQFWKEDFDVTRNFDVKKGDEVIDMFNRGIVDPTKVARCVIQNAVSAAKTFLTTECAIVELPQEPVPSGKGQR